MAERKTQLEYQTRETHTKLKLNLDGEGAHTISTGIPFFDHMLAQLAFHGCFDLELTCKGDLEVDSHHTVEDVGIALGRAFSQALGTRAGIRRFAHAYYPMDETLARAVVDISGRPEFHFEGAFTQPNLGGMDTQMIPHFFKSLAMAGGLTLHMALLAGENDHHKAEGLFKALGRALDDAARPEPRRQGVASTKGKL
ncbi:MAG: imidazoleglycerol-phosphate dehydratase HisB [Deltaproteobacteria bacterium]|nr:imidazoleglycerol-phosphate dehydratase HisB [Deltaproteobacteria bacterium]